MNEADNLTRREALKWVATGVALAGAAYVDGCSKGPAANASATTNMPGVTGGSVLTGSYDELICTD